MFPLQSSLRTAIDAALNGNQDLTSEQIDEMVSERWSLVEIGWKKTDGKRNLDCPVSFPHPHIIRWKMAMAVCRFNGY